MSVAMTKPGRQRATPRSRDLVALMRYRLRRTWGSRIGRISAILVAAGFVAVAFALTKADGSLTSLVGLMPRSARWLAWLAAGPALLSAANARSAVDRAEGVHAFAMSRGASFGAVSNARTVATMIEVALLIAVPVMLVGMVSTALSASSHQALLRVLSTVMVVGFAVAAGATLGVVASASSRLAGARGRSLFSAIILVPWVIADVSGHVEWSIPGALDALLLATEQLVRG